MAKRKSKATPAKEPAARGIAITMEPEEGLPVPVSSHPMVNPESLIAQAIKNKLPVETLERLLVMRRELKAEWSKEQYFAALSAFQVECPPIAKTKEVLNKDGTTVRYRYAPLDAIIAQVKELLDKHGFSYSVQTEQGQASVTAIMDIHHVAGHSETTKLIMPIESDAHMTASQRVGSALTYAKRYAFCDGFGVMTADEDDDANSKAEPKDKPPPAEPPKKSDAPARNVTPPAEPKGTAPAQPAQPTEPTERKLPDDPAFKGMKQPGIEAYWLLVDAYKQGLLSKAYCEKEAQRIRLNAPNADFLVGIKETIQANILMATKAKKEKKA